MRIFRLATVSAAFGLAVLGGTGWASLAAPAAQASTAQEEPASEGEPG